jgi:hypothetical protein
VILKIIKFISNWRVSKIKKREKLYKKIRGQRRNFFNDKNGKKGQYFKAILINRVFISKRSNKKEKEILGYGMDLGGNRSTIRIK